MEKRTFIFMLALAASFVLINFFFTNQRVEQEKEWAKQHAAKNAQKITQLETDISERTAKASALPLVSIYADAQGTDFLTSGLLDKEHIITLSWLEDPALPIPSKIFARPSGTTSEPHEYELLNHPQSLDDPIIYRRGTAGGLLIADLPDFGKFDLQVVTPFPSDKTNPFRITVADYIDGHFSLPAHILHTLSEATESKTEYQFTESIRNPGLVVYKTEQGYLPLAIYRPATQSADYLKDIEALTPLVTKLERKKTPNSVQQKEEKFYVLENSYQQLVFSNKGGALLEINLPFKTDANEKSVVREIEFDREIVEHHSYNAYFPGHPYYTPGATAEGPYTEHPQGKLGGYYPLIRRDLIENKNRKSVKIEPKYYALNIVSEYPEVAQLTYTVKEFSKEKIVFEAVQSLRTITKTFSIATEDKGAPYCIDLAIKIDGDSRGLWLTSGIPEVEWFSGAPAPALKYRVTRNGKGYVENLDLPKDAFTSTTVEPDWIVTSNGFFGIIMNPLSTPDSGFRAQRVSGTSVPSRLVEVEQEYDKYKAQEMPGFQMMIPLTSKTGLTQFHIFAGPFADDTLKQVDRFYSDPATGYNPDFIASQTFHGWFAFISEPFAKFLFLLMRFFYFITNSWGFSIILLTIALRLMLYPLNAWSMKSMAKMQVVAPQIASIQERYKNDSKKAQVEIMNLYREKGINPLSGCLPLLIQMPFLIGMFDLLKSTFELRGASFIPGWIDNLASPDILFSWSTPLFFIGNQFHFLPILLGLVMFLQQRLMTTLPKDPAQWTEQQRQQRAMGTMMTFVFAFMFYNFPSGLNIYWLSSMILGILQQWWTQKNMQPAGKTN